MNGAPLTCFLRKTHWLLIIASLLCAFTSAHGQTIISWGSSTGSWNTPANWTLGSLPQTGERASLTGGNASVDSNVTVDSISLGGGTISGPADLTLTGDGSTWTSGTMSGSGSTIIDTGAAIAISSTNVHDLNGRDLTNKGIINWSLGALRGGNGTTLTNAAGATFNDLNASSYSINNPFGGAYIFANDGTYTRNVTGTTYIDATFNNSGTVNLLMGNLQLRGGGTTSSSGSINASSGSTVKFTSGYTVDNGASLTGAGDFEITGGTVTINGTIAASNLTQSGGVFEGTNTIDNIFNWNSGDWDTAATGPSTTIASTGTLNIATTNVHDLHRRAVINEGTVNWTLGNIRGGNGSTFTNKAGATFNDLHTSGYVIDNPFGGSFIFTNEGTYVRNETSTTFFDATFDNSGTVNVLKGDIEIRNAGKTTSTGSINVSSGSNVTFTNGYTVDNGASLTGAGDFNITGGTVTINGTIAAGNLTQSGGTFEGTNTISNIFNWNSGDWDTGATGPSTTIASTGTLNIATTNVHDLHRRAVINEGTVNWTLGNIRGGNGSTFTNKAGATFKDLHTSGYVIDNPFGGSFIFTNEGTYVRNETGTTYFDATFDNSGTVNVLKGDIEIRNAGKTTSTGSINVSSGSTVKFTNGYTVDNGASLTGAGDFEITGGTVTINGSIAAGNLTQSGGVFEGTNTISNIFNWNSGSWDTATTGPSTTIASTGTLNIASGNVHDLRRRAVINEGTVNWTAGNIRGGNGSTFTNKAGATFNDLHTSIYTFDDPFGGTYTFTNEGTYVRNETGTTYIDATFNNSGALNVLKGDIQFRKGGTISSTGSISASNGTNVIFTNGYTVDDGSSLTGAGNYSLTGGTFTLNGTLGADTFTQTGGTLTGTGKISKIFNWNGGNWSATSSGPTTTITSTGTLNLGTTSYKDFNYQAIVNEGTVNWYLGHLRSGNGGSFTNAAGGLFNDLNASSYSYSNPFGGTFVFTNDGTYTRNVAGTTNFGTTFNNNNTVNLQQGTIKLSGGGTMSATSVVDVSSGAILDFTSDYTLASGAQLTGAGAIQQTGGTLTVDGILKASLFDWRGGDWNAPSAATTTIDATTILNLTHTANKDFRYRTISNQGTVNWSLGHIRSGNGGSFINASGATFNDLNASSYSVSNPFGGTFVFTNDGTYTRNVAGTTTFNTTFNNSNTVNLQQGTIKLAGGGTMSSASVTNVSSGATLDFTNNYTLASGAQLNGAGAIRQTGGTLTIDGILKASLFDWRGGNWNALSAVTTTVDAATTLNLSTTAYKDFNYRTINNLGTINWYLGYIRSGNSGSLVNASGATFNDLNASSYSVNNPFGGTFVFTNDGTYTRNVAGTTTFSTTFDNNNTVNLQQGTIKLAGGGTMSATSVVDVSSGATLDFTNNYAIQTGSKFTGVGAIQQTAGTLTIDGILKASLFDWRGGDWNASSAATTTIDAATILNLSTSSYKDFNYRTISNLGTINWYLGYIRSGNGGSLVNASGATFNDLNASSYSVNNPFGGTFVFTNDGTYTRNVAGTTTFSTTFDNNNTVNLQQGTIKLAGGGTMSATSIVNASPGTIFQFTNDYTLLSGSQLTGTGLFQQLAGTLLVEKLTASNFSWQAGDWNSASSYTTTIANTTTLNLDGTTSKNFDGRTIINQGTINWNAGYFRSGNGGSFTNAVGGMFNDINPSGYSIQNIFGGAFSVYNYGTYKKTGSGTSQVQVPFENNNGSVLVDTGTLRFTSTFNQIGGAISLSNGGKIQFDNGLTLTAGSLSGSGTVIGNVTNYASINPGDPLGALNITGTISFDSTSVLTIGLGGTTQGVDYDFLNITGTSILDGILALAFDNGFQSTVTNTDTFTILQSAGFTGEFSNVADGFRLTTTDGLGSFVVNYSSIAVSLSDFQAVPEPSTWALLGLGGAVIAIAQYRRRSRARKS